MLSAIQPLNPVAFELGPLSVRWYGILIGLGIVVAYLLAVREGKRRGIQEETFMDLLIWAIPLAILGARLYYVIFQWEYYDKNPGDIFAIWKGGLAIHGGLLAAIIVAIIFCRKRGISFWKLADIAAPSIIIAQAIGRWGNFFNQEAHGGPVTREFLEGLYLPEFMINQMYINGEYYHPTFLYESLWNVLGFLVLINLRKVNLKQGEIFLSYIIWYSAGRFFIEGLRTDSLYFFDIRVAQLVSVVSIIVALALIIWRRTLAGVPRYLDRPEPVVGVAKKRKRKKRKK